MIFILMYVSILFGSPNNKGNNNVFPSAGSYENLKERAGHVPNISKGASVIVERCCGTVCRDILDMRRHR